VGKLAAIEDMVKGFNPNARRSFGDKHKPSRDRLPAQIKDKTLFPDTTPKPTKSLSGGGGVKGSGLYEQKHKQLLLKLKDYSEDCKRSIPNVTRVFDEIKEHAKYGSRPSPNEIKNYRDIIYNAEKLIEESDVYLPDDDQMSDAMPEEYSKELSNSLNRVRALEDWVDGVRREVKHLGIPL
jgi:hypothetical protein